MSRASYVAREFRCLRCHGSDADRNKHFRARFWTARAFLGKPLAPSYYDLRCLDCGANAAWFEPWPRPCVNFITPLRDDMRPVVFRWHDKQGREHYRYPSSTDPRETSDALPRPNEERIDFPTLRSMESFLKEQNPNYRDWQVPLNDILDYDHGHLDAVASDTSDPEAEALARDMECVDDAGVATEADVERFMADTSARALIEQA